MAFSNYFLKSRSLVQVYTTCQGEGTEHSRTDRNNYYMNAQDVEEFIQQVKDEAAKMITWKYRLWVSGPNGRQKSLIREAGATEWVQKNNV